MVARKRPRTGLLVLALEISALATHSSALRHARSISALFSDEALPAPDCSQCTGLSADACFAAIRGGVDGLEEQSRLALFEHVFAGTYAVRWPQVHTVKWVWNELEQTIIRHGVDERIMDSPLVIHSLPVMKVAGSPHDSTTLSLSCPAETPLLVPPSSPPDLELTTKRSRAAGDICDELFADACLERMSGILDSMQVDDEQDVLTKVREQYLLA